MLRNSGLVPPLSDGDVELIKTALRATAEDLEQDASHFKTAGAARNVLTQSAKAYRELLGRIEADEGGE